MRILLFGGSGQLGFALVHRTREHEMLVPDPRVDVRDRLALAAAFDAYHPDAAINCTAFNQVDRAESVPEEAFASNSVAVYHMARACNERDITFLTVSTDYVFDGLQRTPYREQDIPRPLTAYGMSKYAGELLAQYSHEKLYIVRTAGLYGNRVSASKGYTFIDRILTQARAGEPVRVVDDIVCSPTYAEHLADAIVALLSTGASGLYHAVNEGAVSWYEFAVEALRQAGIQHDVESISQASLNGAAPRPAYSALSSEKLRALGITMPSWQDGIASYLRHVDANGAQGLAR